ncbi:molybdate ABC transporter substrate-binding protein [Bacillus aquiflavi]|uniref:Molybdate ABC transporter substrate-binding protein n=1 Tax=Bacillus aquiflavi TaxID=2672567 RepID=A0A6B3W509_9BACI|nr:molybdate ABC transporter substrate-binding protein [Bacillus aquiflavi]MBA4538646.1 molybdate ABC transporter substrate-binding protein [Bacillus aquiflavi]NEY83006.1 molybdate ABC transporter substrate-binding protein [Bacillus aquiflavi]UAC49583.1 molybdate ABC transporter substrate-binding protein [Bacillus aquiflavi]
MKKIVISLLLLIVLISLTSCSSTSQEKEVSNAPKKEITISAAASLNEVMQEMKNLYEQDNKNIKLLFNFGGSGALQQQISQGAPVDLFISASEDKFNFLKNEGLIADENSKNLVGNELVLITYKDSPKQIKTFEDLTNEEVEKISIGTPESVPAGKYAKQTFGFLNIWNQVESKLVFAKDVRQVLTYVETGNVDAGIVYKTDAATSDNVMIVSTANKESHDPIIYPAGIIENSKHKEEAVEFFTFLQSKEAKDIFIKYGFKVLD